MKTTAAAKKTRTHSPCVLNRNTDSQHDRPDARRGRARRAGARHSLGGLRPLRGWCPIVWCRRVCDDRVIHSPVPNSLLGFFPCTSLWKDR